MAEAQFDPSTHPHRRGMQSCISAFYTRPDFLSVNPLTGEYVLVSPHRTKRPWLGQTEPPQQASLAEYDPKCYLCPGNTRAGGLQNDKYEHTMVFENDFAAVLPPPGPAAPAAPHPLLTTEPVQGGCDVICFHPRHDLTLARLPVPDIQRIIDEWCSIYKKRGSQEDIKYVQIFEVRGMFYNLHSTAQHTPEQRSHHGMLESASSWTSVVSLCGAITSCHGTGKSQEIRRYHTAFRCAQRAPRPLLSLV